MNKPITLLISETKANLAQAINNALTTFPPCIVEEMIMNMYNEIRVLSQKQLHEDELAYANSQNENKQEPEPIKK